MYQWHGRGYLINPFIYYVFNDVPIVLLPKEWMGLSVPLRFLLPFHYQFLIYILVTLLESVSPRPLAHDDAEHLAIPVNAHRHREWYS